MGLATGGPRQRGIFNVTIDYLLSVRDSNNKNKDFTDVVLQFGFSFCFL